MRGQRPTAGLTDVGALQTRAFRGAGACSFIPYAEESGLIAPITRQVMTDARTRLADWRVQVDDAFQVAVNVSPQLFRQTEIGELFDEPAPALEGLVIEVTESLFLDVDESRVRTNLGWLRRHGARIAVDDFGNGYSSLAYLRNFAKASAEPTPMIDILLIEDSTADAELTRELLSRTAYARQAAAFVTKPVRLGDFGQVIQALDAFWLNAVRYPSNIALVDHDQP